jgi:hypothetical protein
MLSGARRHVATRLRVLARWVDSPPPRIEEVPVDDDPPAYPDEVPCPHPSEACTSCGAGPGQPCLDPSFLKENQR